MHVNGVCFSMKSSTLYPYLARTFAFRVYTVFIYRLRQWDNEDKLCGKKNCLILQCDSVANFKVVFVIVFSASYITLLLAQKIILNYCLSHQQKVNKANKIKQFLVSNTILYIY